MRSVIGHCFSGSHTRIGLYLGLLYDSNRLQIDSFS